MGQLDEADSQYRRAMELEPGSAAFKAEAHLVDVVRNNLKQGRQCLEEGDARHVPHRPPFSSPPTQRCAIATYWLDLHSQTSILCPQSLATACGDTLVHHLFAV